MSWVRNTSKYRNNFIILSTATFLAAAEKNTWQTLVLGEKAEAALAKFLFKLYEGGTDTADMAEATKLWVAAATILGMAYANIGHYEPAWVMFSSSYQKVANRFPTLEIAVLSSMAWTAFLQNATEEAKYLRKLMLYKGYSDGNPSKLVDVTTEAAVLYHMETHQVR